MYVLNPYLLSFFTVCSLNSTTATINLYSTSIPKQHAHILVDNKAQHEGTRGGGRLFLHVVKKRYACIWRLPASLYHKRAGSLDASPNFVVPCSVARSSPRLCRAGLDRLLWRTIRLDCNWSQLLSLSPVGSHASVALHPNEENCHVCWAHTADSASLTYCLWTHLQMNHTVQS